MLETNDYPLPPPIGRGFVFGGVLRHFAPQYTANRWHVTPRVRPPNAIHNAVGNDESHRERVRFRYRAAAQRTAARYHPLHGGCMVVRVVRRCMSHYTHHLTASRRETVRGGRTPIDTVQFDSGEGSIICTPAPCRRAALHAALRPGISASFDQVAGQAGVGQSGRAASSRCLHAPQYGSARQTDQAY